MLFISIKPFKRYGIDKFFDIPLGSRLDKRADEALYFHNFKVCFARSSAAHEYFARDDDGQGLLRGALSHSIIHSLSINPDLWQIVWNDSICQNYRRIEHFDFWLWSDDFFNAPISDLQYIFNLLKDGVFDVPNY